MLYILLNNSLAQGSSPVVLMDLKPSSDQRELSSQTVILLEQQLFEDQPNDLCLNLKYPLT